VGLRNGLINPFKEFLNGHGNDMELGSKEHKQLLMNGIVKSAFKTAVLGGVIGILLFIPSFVRENTFSMGLVYLGSVIILVSVIYALWIAFKKYQKIIKPFNETFNK